MDVLHSSGRNAYRNNSKMIEVGNRFWSDSAAHGLMGIVANRRGDNRLLSEDGHAFINFGCCSYLDLDCHPAILAGAHAALDRYGALDHCTSRVRVQLPALLELEAALGELFQAPIVTAISASAATTGLLPLLASGHLTQGQRPLMVFDKHAHFGMNLMKPVCADETEVLTCPHNDLNFIEDACKRHAKVAYVADGTYSMGGHAPLRELLDLQQRYGLFLYFDDSHGLSIYGEQGQGFVRSQMPELNADTIILTTLNKAFGTSGAAIMFGPRGDAAAQLLARFGGPLTWSQPMNTAAIGASLASAALHRTPELQQRQAALLRNIALFDAQVQTEQRGNRFPIKLVTVANDRVARCAQALYAAGFYVPPVFFPIVAREAAGLRVMLHANNTPEEILRLTAAIHACLQEE
ncbi:8-amino-7-oxononanoate synthase family protein [Pseudoduganella violacea]|uniref:7-keto-8-aminopelargonate synthetase-like enzyme n=1 Tax=Pseudoduganella violacea TaxID=1715466 RepID=A0A7W5B7T3_9BURK|nr:aminotransferase class I/II-fold pyridoxal phosphate-dependent enzyme [Pseudoduganella violacea]MBB3118016.1 7-keto-8-aminopelargonate synthetase-like enzyme [Pseudoduganella violacea]